MRFFTFAWIRHSILGVWLLATAVAVGVSIAGFRIDNSVGVWFASDDPALTEYRRFLEDFGSREWILVAFRQRGGNQADLASERADLVSRMERLEHVHTVLSAANLPEDSEFVRRFLKPDSRSVHEALLLQITNDIDRQDGYREALVADLRTVAEGLASIEHVHVAGTAVFNGELNRAARRDMFLFFPAVAVFVALLGGVLFRNTRDTVVLLCVSLGTVTITQGLLIGVGYPLNMVTIMLPTVLIALSVADAVHLIHAFHAARPHTSDSVHAAGRAVRDIAWPCTGTTLTTIAGFLAFSGSSVLPVFQLSIFASFGIALAWLVTMTGAPILLAVLWGRTEQATPVQTIAAREILERWSQFVNAHPRWIVSVFAAGSVALVGLASLKADTNYAEFFRANARVPRDYEAFRRANIPQNPLNLVFELPPGSDHAAPRSLMALESFAQQLEDLPGVHSVLSPFVLADLTDGATQIASAGMLSRNGDQIQLIAMMHSPSSRELLRQIPEIRALADRVLPADMRMTATGTALLWARMDAGVIQTQKESLAIVCVVCFGILVLLFRSPRMGALGLVLSLYPVAIVLGLMGLLDIPVNMATVLIAGIAVGLAVDDTIHFVHAYRTSLQSGNTPQQASEHATVGVGLRMVMTSLILVGAFASMGLSDFLPTSQFGLLSSLTITLALAADLTLLPVLLSWRRAPVAEHRARRELERLDLGSSA